MAPSESYPRLALAKREAWEALPVWERWYYLVRVYLMFHRAALPFLVALVFIAAAILTWAMDQSVFYGLFMLILGAALALIFVWARPRK